MKIVVSSDWHADWSTLGVSRFAEVESAVLESVAHAIKIGAGAYLFPGDLSDPDTGGAMFRAQALAITAALELSRAGIQSVWIPGNHDVSEDGSGASTLTPLEAVAKYDGNIHVALFPRLVELTRDLEVLCLPFVASSHGVDMGEAATKLWPTRDRQVIVLSHLTVPGIIPGTETNEMPRGREVTYPFEETKRAFMRIQGHFHRRQIFDPEDGGPPLIIPGALARLTFGGDEDLDPSFLVLDV